MYQLISLICFLVFALTGCTPHYHTVRLSKGMDAKGDVVTYYAVTRNGVVIPEYVIDDKGNYPDTKEEAEKRFHERKDHLDEIVKKKYVLPANTSYEIQRNTVGLGLLAVSPIVMPLDMLSNAYREKKTGLKMSQKSYLESSFEEPVPKDPKLKDEISQNS